MFAIQNVKTKKFVYGTDYRYFPYRQKTSARKMLTFEDFNEANLAFRYRECGKSYKIVCLKTVEVNRILDPK